MDLEKRSKPACEMKLEDALSTFEKAKDQDMVDRVNHVISRLGLLQESQRVLKEEKVMVRFLGQIYHKGGDWSVKKGDTKTLPKSEAEYLLKTFKKDWEVVKGGDSK